MENNIGYYPSFLPGKIASTLVAHGLNLKPEAMLPLVEWLTAKGSDVYLVKLPGHHPNSIDIKDVTGPAWESEMVAGYRKARQSSVENSVPLYFLGYSLGALLGQTMVALRMKDATFDKQVLFAPAIAMRKRSYLLKALLLLGKKRMLPSYTPEGYRANNALPLSVYEILFAEEKKVFKSRFETLKIPTLILIDPKDELISFKRLKRLKEKFGLENCRVVTVGEDAERSTQYHHLIINEQVTGRSSWIRITAAMENFFGFSAAK